MARDGTITSLTAYLTSLANITAELGTTGTASIIAQIYQSTTSDNVFIPSGASVTLNPVSTTFYKNTASLNIPVTQEEQLLVVFSVVPNSPLVGIDVSLSLAGVGGSINIV